MEGSEITLWRTAAASVVATQHIRGLDNKYDTLAIVGAGAQAKIHAIAFQEIFKFKKVKNAYPSSICFCTVNLFYS